MARKKPKMRRRQRVAPAVRARGRLGLPDDLLDAIIGLSDLRTLRAAAASVEFRDGFARRAPGLARGLVVRRFPILKGVDGNDRSPRELFQSQQRLFPAKRPHRARPPDATAPLADYVFFLEIETRPMHFGPQVNTYPASLRESVHTGTAKFTMEPVGVLDSRGVLEFTIPAGVLERCFPDIDDRYRNRPKCYIRAMVSRRTTMRRGTSRVEIHPRGERLEFARVGMGEAREFGKEPDGTSMVCFPDLEELHADMPIGLVEWISAQRADVGRDDLLQLAPAVIAVWTGRDAADGAPTRPSTVSLSFVWTVEREVSHAMVRREICQVLEHLVEWR